MGAECAEDAARGQLEEDRIVDGCRFVGCFGYYGGVWDPSCAVVVGEGEGEGVEGFEEGEGDEQVAGLKADCSGVGLNAWGSGKMNWGPDESWSRGGSCEVVEKSGASRE